MEFAYILCDLDGTIFDDRQRHYRCYCDIVTKYGGTCVTEERYWELKRKKIKRTVLLEETKFEGAYEDYANEWLERIEQISYLELEAPKEGAIEVLKYLKSKTNYLFLVTNRCNRENLLKQLEWTGVLQYFDKILTGNPVKQQKKYDIVGQLEKGNILVIGDSEADQELAEHFKAKFIGMTDGLREQKYLQADIYLNNIVDLNKYV